ncbi:MAG: hypothetical protein H7249_05785 [Chitinophagaceae bacterium]|nr:hypothetical protein [Oligoflexus sp.]
MKALLALLALTISCAESKLSAALTADQKSVGTHKSGMSSESDGANADQTSQSQPMINTTMTPIESQNTVLSPVVITGAYLHCAKLSEFGTQIEMGCRLDDQNGARIPPLTIAKGIAFSTVVPPISSLQITLTQSTSLDTVYDAHVEIFASTLDIVRTALASIQVQATLDQPNDVNLAQNFNNALSNTVPAEDGLFKVSGAVSQKIVLDQMLNIYFTRLSGADRNWNDSKTDCAVLTLNNWKWKLVEYPILPQAHTHGIYRNTEASVALFFDKSPMVWMNAYPSYNAATSYAFRMSDSDESNIENLQVRTSTIGLPLCMHEG